MSCNTDALFHVTAESWHEQQQRLSPVEDLGNGMKSIYMLSLLETYIEDEKRIPSIIMVEYPELFLHPSLQKAACEILYRLSQKNQVFFTTHSCTNIRTYANLKYINQVYLQDQFLMIRDGDGKDPEELAEQLCRYYDERGLTDVDKLPRLRRRNVLILKYYSFENYFLNPAVMTQLGIVESEDAFYRTLYEKWREYLHRIVSGRRLTALLGRDFTSADDIREHMELFKIHMREHNLYDIFYGPYKKEERKLLMRYIQLAPWDDFKDILDAIDAFPFFESRRNL